jgi:general secretion pathway protein A
MYEQFYGLTARPFQLTPDPAFYFESATHKKALSYLGYGLAQGEGFIVITGEVGAGKSTLVAHLMATVDPGRLTAAQIVTSKLGGEEIVHVVAQAFGLAVEGHDKASALGAVECFLHEEARAGRRCLLVVDESQNLSIEALEELRMLSNFQLGAHPLLQTLLLGQPEFRATLLEHPGLDQLRQRVIATHHLDAMEADEVRPYAEHRLNLAGWSGSPALDDGLFAEIFAVSHGVPRRVNQLFNRLLLLGSVEDRDAIDAGMLKQILDEFDEDGVGSLLRAGAGRPETIDEFQPHLFAHLSPPAIDDATIARIEEELADRDVQISELQQAVIEMANASDQDTASSDAVAALEARIAQLEERLAEQDRTLRHTLTMMIEWIEADGAQRAAA